MYKIKIIIVLQIFFICLNASAATFYAARFGVIGDGITDDGPAIRKAMNAVIESAGKNTLIFDAAKSYYVKNVEDIYLFSLKSLADITIDGGGSVFLLDGNVRFINLNQSKNIFIRNLSVDYKPLPFADGLIIAKKESERYVDIKIPDEFDMPPLGGPINKRGEQAFFGMLWNQGTHSLLSTHYWVKDIRESYKGSSADRIIRVQADPNFKDWKKIVINETKMSVPVRGIAHIGGNEVFKIIECKNVYFRNVNIWSAPWFAVGVSRNKGEVQFKNVNIQPKPGTQRLTSSWRDGFHVKGNYANLLWEDCRIEGTNDDSFNIASFMSTIQVARSDKEITIKQNYPLDIIPYNQGDAVVIYDVEEGKIQGKAKVSGSQGFIQSGKTPAPEITIILDHAITGMHGGCQVWNESSANPHTILRRCHIFNSCRFQSPITIEKSELIALSWFYGSDLEGPIPSNVVVKDSKLFLGRGNDKTAISVSAEITKNGVLYNPKKQVIFNFLLKNNIIDGNLDISYAKNVSVINNKFLMPRSSVSITNSRNVTFKNNSIGDIKLNSPDQIKFDNDLTKTSTTIK